MSRIRNMLLGLLTVLPAILLMTFMNVFVTSSVAGVVMVELQATYPGTRWPLGVAILVAVIVYSWLVFNYKLRFYIKERGTVDE